MERCEHVVMGRELDGKKGRLTDFPDTQTANYLEYCGLGVDSKGIRQRKSKEERKREEEVNERDHHV